MESKRPGVITAICILIGIGIVLVALGLLGGAGSLVGAWYTPYLLLVLVANSAALVGMWQMKKWGAMVYTGVTVVNQIVAIAMGMWSVSTIVLPAIVIGLIASKYDAMK